MRFETEQKFLCVASIFAVPELLFDGTDKTSRSSLVYNELCHNELLFVTNNLIRKFLETTNENFVITQLENSTLINIRRKKLIKDAT